MSLKIPEFMPPSQGGDDLKLSVLFLENNDAAALTIEVNLILEVMESNPRSYKFLADIQYSSAQMANNVVNYSCMIVRGEYNP